MRSSYLSLASALAFSLATLAAHAQAVAPEPVPPPPPVPRAADQSKGEILAARQFGWLDIDHDGYLSRDEVALFPRLRDAFDQADTDRDNRVSFDEIRALAVQRRNAKAGAPAAIPGTVVPPAPPMAAAPVAPEGARP